MRAPVSLFLIVGLLLAPCALAQRQEPLPDQLEGVEITENLNGQVDLDLEFIDEAGDKVALKQFFHDERPVILTLVYYRCPMLCGLVLNGLVDTLKDLDWTPGQQFEIVTVSINPLETPKLATLKKQNTLKGYERPGAGSGWHFLTGKQEDIDKLAGEVGFGYRYVEETGEYAHPAAIFILTPDGRISRYLSGIQNEPRTMRLALVEASDGGIGSALDQFILSCFHYDADAGRYAPAAMKIMRLGGGATVVILGIALLAFWLRESRRRAKA
jgi:protein SCO1/2